MAHIDLHLYNPHQASASYTVLSIIRRQHWGGRSVWPGLYPTQAALILLLYFAPILQYFTYSVFTSLLSSYTTILFLYTDCIHYSTSLLFYFDRLLPNTISIIFAERQFRFLSAHVPYCEESVVGGIAFGFLLFASCEQILCGTWGKNRARCTSTGPQSRQQTPHDIITDSSKRSIDSILVF